METSRGFPPVAGKDARVLVLGSLPGQKSLCLQEYYAHPQNGFWPIMKALFGTSGSYENRCSGLIEHKVALWDVLQASCRPGSMDADIRQDTATANDFSAFLLDHPEVEKIAFNGKKAEQLFRRMVSRESLANLDLTGLPSTSPAYAAMPFRVKLREWEAGLDNVTPPENRRGR